MTIRGLLRQFGMFAGAFLRVKTKQGTLEPLRLNLAQQRLNELWEQQVSEGRPVRIIVLKARRLGISTYSAARGYFFVTTQKNRHFKLVSHEKESAEELFEMSKCFYDNFPEAVADDDGVIYHLRPETKHSNRKELSFAELGSKITIKTAGVDSAGTNSSGVGRSQTVHFLHCSEVAFWPNAEQTLVSLLQTVPALPGTAVILESTANGVGDHFYRLVKSAQCGDSDYQLLFLPWWIFPEYAMPVEGELIPTAEEAMLAEQYGLSLEQLNWRRRTIRNECQGSVDMFHQEYPSSIDEAFLVTGRSFFNKHRLAEITTRTPIWVGDISAQGAVSADTAGDLRIWQYPQPYHSYVIGADVAEGLDTGDYSVAQVIDRDTLEQVAEWHGHIDPELFGDVCVGLGVYYNNAIVAPENNNHGLTTVKRIQQLEYGNIYIEHNVTAAYAAVRLNRAGWRTDVRTRPLMLDALQGAIRDDTIVINSSTTLGELATFVVKANGIPAASGDCHDDTVMALAIALYVHVVMPRGVVARQTPEDAYLQTLTDAEKRVKEEMIQNAARHKREVDISRITS